VVYLFFICTVKEIPENIVWFPA